MLFIVPLVCLSNVTVGYFLIESGKELLLAEKRNHLFGVTHLLREYLVQRGGFASLQGRAVIREDQIRVLNRELADYTESIARAFSGIGVGYYHRGLDAILTYGPQIEYGITVGKAISPTHRGRQVMESGMAAIESGMQVRGNIMNAMTPIVEQGHVVGYVWANELIDRIDQQLASMRNTVLLFGAFSLLFSLLVVFWVVTRLTRDVSTIQRSLVAIETDLAQRIPPMSGEIGDIAGAINKMAHSLFESRLKEREQAANALRQQEETLRAAIEAIDEAFVLFDPEDRLVYCNQRYLELFPQMADMMVPGNTFEQIVRAFCQNGLYPQAHGREEMWIRERIELHRSGKANFEIRTEDGHWLQIVDRKTRTGHIVGFRVDITNLKQATEAAEAANRKLAELASRDGLTGLLNRRSMDLQIDSTWDEAISRNISCAAAHRCRSLQELQRSTWSSGRRPVPAAGGQPDRRRRKCFQRSSGEREIFCRPLRRRGIHHCRLVDFASRI